MFNLFNYMYVAERVYTDRMILPTVIGTHKGRRAISWTAGSTNSADLYGALPGSLHSHCIVIWESPRPRSPEANSPEIILAWSIQGFRQPLQELWNLSAQLRKKTSKTPNDANAFDLRVFSYTICRYPEAVLLSIDLHEFTRVGVLEEILSDQEQLPWRMSKQPSDSVMSTYAGRPPKSWFLTHKIALLALCRRCMCCKNAGQRRKPLNCQSQHMLLKCVITCEEMTKVVQELCPKHRPDEL